MGSFLQGLIVRLLLLLLAYGLLCFQCRADVWSSCEDGTGPAVSVSSCYGPMGGAPYGACPYNQILAVDDLSSRVDSDWPDGKACYDGTIQGPAPTLNADTQYGYFKQCRGPNGEDRGGAGIVGGKLCTAQAACSLPVGSEIAAGGFSMSAYPTQTYCVQHCQVSLQSFGLTVGPPGAPSDYAAPVFVVTDKICVVNTPPPSQFATWPYGEQCIVFNERDVCISSQSSAVEMTINQMKIETGPDGTVCGDGQCVESGQVVETANGILAESSTPSPPAPASTPDLQISSGNGTFNYWAPSTGGTTGSTTGSTSGGSTGGGTPGVTCGGSGQPECSVKLVGSFTAPPNEQTAPTFAESLTTFNTSIQSAPIVAALSGIAEAIPTEGQVPGGDVTLDALGGVTLHLAPPQEVIDAIAPVLSALSIAAWVLLGCLIIISA